MICAPVRLVASVGIAVVLWLPALAGAQTKASYELTYEGAQGCPAEAAFRRAALSHVHDTSATGARIQVRIEKGQAGQAGETEFRGELTATDEEGHVGRRSIQGPTCKTVAQALAFLAGLAIELGGRLKAEEPPEAAPATPPPAPAPPPPLVEVRGPLAVPSESAGLGVSVALLGEVRIGFAPSLSPGVQAAMDVEARRAGLFAPSFRVGVAGAWAELEDQTGSASLRYLAGRLEGCPIRIPAVRDARAEVRPCAGFELGHVWAESHASTNAKNGAQWVPSGEAILRFKWRFFEGFFFEADAAVGVPFVRPRYFFQPDHVLYEVPPVTARAALGCGYRF